MNERGKVLLSYILSLQEAVQVHFVSKTSTGETFEDESMQRKLTPQVQFPMPQEPNLSVLYAGPIREVLQ